MITQAVMSFVNFTDKQVKWEQNRAYVPLSGFNYNVNLYILWLQPVVSVL